MGRRFIHPRVIQQLSGFPNVRIEQLTGTRRIARFNGINQVRMIANNFGEIFVNAMTQCDHAANANFDGFPQLHQEAVLRAATNRRVKLKIELVQECAVARLHGAFHVPHNLAQLLYALGVPVFNHAAHGKGLQDTPNTIDFFNRGRGNLGDECTFVWITLHQSFFFQLAERLADGTATGAELGGDLDLIHLLTR